MFSSYSGTKILTCKMFMWLKTLIIIIIKKKNNFTISTKVEDQFEMSQVTDSA